MNYPAPRAQGNSFSKDTIDVVYARSALHLFDEEIDEFLTTTKILLKTGGISWFKVNQTRIIKYKGAERSIQIYASMVMGVSDDFGMRKILISWSIKLVLN